MATVYLSMSNKQTPLGPIEEEALDRLSMTYDAVTDTFERETAVDVLSEIDLDPSAAQSVLNRLQSKGYIYAVEDGLRITD